MKKKKNSVLLILSALVNGLLAVMLALKLDLVLEHKPLMVVVLFLLTTAATLWGIALAAVLFEWKRDRKLSLQKAFAVLIPIATAFVVRGAIM